MRTNKRYGWRKDLPDHRDKLFSYNFYETPSIPTTVDLRSGCPPILDQGNLGSCTANAISAAVDFEVKKQGKALIDPSRLFIYFLERQMEGTINADSGAEIRDGLKSVAKFGVAPESMWPYNIDRFTVNPTQDVYVAAHSHLIESYLLLAGFPSMKRCLASGFPFIFGFTVYESFESGDVARTGIATLPTKNEAVVGGHAVLCVGYDDFTRRVMVQNSWGTGWGMKGYFEMPYDYITNPNLASDMWSIRLVEM